MRRGSALASGLVTALSTIVVSAAAAVAGVLLAQRYGRSDETDGFFAAYAVYGVISLAGYSLRVVVLPDLARADAEGRLRAELGGYCAALAVVAVPAVLVIALLAGPIADAVTSNAEQSEAFAAALPWLVGSGALQVVAAVAAAALAARDSYGVAALGYGGGAVAGLLLFAALPGRGPVSLAWGLALSGVVTLLVPLIGLARRAALPAWATAELGAKLWAVVRGASFPVSLQALYTIASVVALHLGSGEATTLTYAYIFAATLVGVTASSLSVISSAPLTRRGLSPETAAAHVVHTSWISLALIVAATGVFALAGGDVVASVLGDSFRGAAGDDLVRVVVWLAPWMVASIALTVTFPLLFVLEKPGVLLALAIVLPLVQVPLAWVLGDAFGLPGLAVSLAISTLAGLAVLMAALSRRTLELAARGLGRLAVVEAALGGLSFGAVGLVVGGVAGAAVGLLVYSALLTATRSLGLSAAWAYVRELG
jgi:O-antigen/teichoic acid export membrane protein